MAKRKGKVNKKAFETKTEEQAVALEKNSSKNDLDALSAQCRAEYNYAWEHHSPKKKKDMVRLKLYNNQRRSPEAVGDTTMLTVHQTVVASLYIDRLTVEFAGREEGDDEQAQNLNHLAEYDYQEMQKDILDYYWIWDAGFYGNGYMLMEEYHRDPNLNIFLPVPELVDPISLLTDPKGVDVNGIGFNKRGAYRFWGRPIAMTQHAMKDNKWIFDIDYSKVSHESDMAHKDLMDQAQKARDDAQGKTNDNKKSKEASLGVNAEYDLMLWYTHFEYEGKIQKVKVWLANGMNDVVGVKPLGNNDWGLIRRPLYPNSHDQDGVSIPDLTEDKQRARAVAMNLGMRAMKTDLYANYLYDSTKITNRNDLKAGFNKMIPVDGTPQGAIEPVRKSAPNLGLLNFIYQSLQLSAEKATATPEIQQGVLSQKDRTLGELNLVQAGSESRYSLAAKIFQWSEKSFWKMWYRSYAENYNDEVEEKIIRINGAFGAEWRPLTSKDFLTKRLDPDISIDSKALSRARQLEERKSMSEYFAVALQDPTANRRYGQKKLGKSYNFTTDEIDRLFPPTIDERIASEENELLNEGKQVTPKAEDDHNVHLEIHSKAKDTPATRAHIKVHEKALSIKKVRPDLFPQDPNATAINPTGTGATAPSADANIPIAPSRASGGVAESAGR